MIEPVAHKVESSAIVLFKDTRHEARHWLETILSDVRRCGSSKFLPVDERRRTNQTFSYEDSLAFD